ncbi:MAG: tetratricopeptide repeat protein [Candidatus Obscuribacterales bacterium]|nr:tetratricopeptide repeat protein [Candidatus Obscuribacterales bacterium]
MTDKHRNTSHRRRDAIVIISLLVFVFPLAACRGTVRNEGLSQVEYSSTQPGMGGDPDMQASQVNMEKEQAVADGCLQAWRKAVAGDEATAMKMLEELDSKYSGISSVQFMMGQVKDHFGKHKEAVEHFKKAHSTNTFSSMQTFKLAESMRKAGDSKGAIPHYKRLVGNLERATGDYHMDTMGQLLASVRLGLAEAYHECKQDADALSEVKKVLEADSNNEKAKSLLKELEKAGD